MWNAWEKREIHNTILVGKSEGNGPSGKKKTRSRGKITLNCILNRWDGKVVSGFIWLKTGTYWWRVNVGVS